MSGKEYTLQRAGFFWRAMQNYIANPALYNAMQERWWQTCELVLDLEIREENRERQKQDPSQQARQPQNRLPHPDRNSPR